MLLSLLRRFTRKFGRSTTAPREDAATHALCGDEYRKQRAWARAQGEYQKALALDSGNLRALLGLGILRNEQGRFDESLDLYERAAVIDPDNPALFLNRALALRELGRPEAALEQLAEAGRSGAPTADMLLHRALLLADLGQRADAERLLRQLLDQDPGFNEASWQLATLLLSQGRYREGWTHYAARLMRPDAHARPYRYPEWDGRAGVDTLLVAAEQGLGDELMFASCVEEASRCARHVILECDPRLAPMLQRAFPSHSVMGSKFERDPQFPRGLVPTHQARIGDLPGYVRREAGDFPRHAGYLKADPERVTAWRRRLQALGPRPWIGLAWTGGDLKTRRAMRSVPLDALRPILSAVPGLYLSLQYVDSAAELRAFNDAGTEHVHHFADAGSDYEETAALVEALDAVVSVCTAVVHLAGALGRPVRVLVPYVAEWRYGCEGTEMPWYPSARLFRQHARGEWASVVDGVASALHAEFSGARC